MRAASAAVLATFLASAAFAQAPDYSKSLATVLIFTTTDCPISNRYAPEIKRLAAKFTARGVRFSLVYPVPADTNDVVRTHREKFAYDLPFVRDASQSLVKFAGVNVTPEVAVVDRQGKIVYRGRIDDRYVDFGKERPEPTTHDLEEALNAVVGGKPVAVPETRAIGCYLADLIK